MHCVHMKNALEMQRIRGSAQVMHCVHRRVHTKCNAHEGVHWPSTVCTKECTRNATQNAARKRVHSKCNALEGVHWLCTVCTKKCNSKYKA